MTGLISASFFCFICLSYSFFISYGGNFEGFGNSVQQTVDGGYIVAGVDSNLEDNLLLAKYYSNASLEWVRTLGGERIEGGNSVQQTFDGGYIVTGHTISYGAGYEDVLLVKFHSNGSLYWSITLGGSEHSDVGESVQQTNDGGYIVAGYTSEYGVGGGVDDIFLAKFYSNGSLDWVTVVGGEYSDWGRSVQQTTDGGYIVSGSSMSFSGDESQQFMLLKFFEDGSLDWATTLDGTNDAYSVKQTNDDGYIVTGYSVVIEIGGVITLAKYFEDGNLDWIKALKGEAMYGEDIGWSVSQTSDNGYVVTGVTETSFGLNVFLAKYFEDGGLEWMKKLESPNDDVEIGYSVTTTFDGGYVVAGYGFILGFFLTKVEEDGSTRLNEQCGVDWVTIEPSYNEDVTGQSSLGFVFPDIVFVTSDMNIMNFSYISPNVSVVDAEVAHDCSIYSECYGVYGGRDDHDVCSGNGDCTSLLNGTCDCFENYFGLVCDVTKCNEILSNETDTCSGHGTCVSFDICENCTDDYFGEFCELRQFPSFVYVFGGGDIIDQAYSGDITSDGGYVITGDTYSYGAGDRQAFIARMFPDGSMDWMTVIGGGNLDNGMSVHQTIDGGFIYTGYSSTISATYEEVILAKFYTHGGLEWAYSFSFGDDDFASSVEQTFDGGFIVTGFTNSFFMNGYNDIFLSKHHSDGSMDWAITFGTIDGYDQGRDVKQTSDGGYIVTGDTTSFGGVLDIFLAKFYSNGELEWAISLGGDDGDFGKSVQQTTDGGYIITGYTKSFGLQSENLFLAKFFPGGYLDWFTVLVQYGGKNWGNSVQQTYDGGYIVGGNSYIDREDILLAKYSSNGILEWFSHFDNDGKSDNGFSVKQTFDKGFVITGLTQDGGGSDVFLGKVYSDGEGCGFVKITDGTSEFIDEIFEIPILSISSIDRTVNVSGDFFYPPSIYITYFDDTHLDTNSMLCSTEYACFGTAVESEVCNGHGDCTGVNICSCDSDDYFGDECEEQYCFGYLYNDSAHVCSGHGECIAHDECDCHANYTLLEECSFWNCFGKWKNDSNVCNGEIGNGDKSHGNCTAHDNCVCEHGYQESSSCDWDCHGESHWEEQACGIYGDCIDNNICNCTTTDYIGEYCNIHTCAQISSSDQEIVCSGHGECVSLEICDCDLGYRMSDDEQPNGLCDWWTCFGIHWNERENVCSDGKGECVSYNLCNCSNSFEGEECETWSCGLIDQNDPKTCNGNGICTDPEICDCKFWFIGDLCETNLIYYTVVAPVASITSILFIVLVGTCLCCCCCCICCFVIMLCFAMDFLGIYVFFQSFRLKKFGKLKNIDILLKEQELDSNENIAHLRFKKCLFEIEMDSIKTSRIIGEGGSNSVVFKAIWAGRTVAFKCFKTRHVASDQVSFDEFEKEVEILGSVSHPNIIQFFGACLKPPRVGIVMEFCPNGEILEFIIKFRKKNLTSYPFIEKIRLLMEVCAALEYLHDKNVIHRDLKSENVLISTEITSKLMDFGLSRCVKSMDSTKTQRIGTSFYMAPEIITSNQYDEKCDVFSYGIMMYIVLTENSKPYEGMSKGEFGIELIVCNNPDFRPPIEEVDVHDGYEWVTDMIERCWDHDPIKRYSCEEIRDIIEKKGSSAEFERRMMRHSSKTFFQKMKSGNEIKMFINEKDDEEEEDEGEEIVDDDKKKDKKREVKRKVKKKLKKVEKENKILREAVVKLEEKNVDLEETIEELKEKLKKALGEEEEEDDEFNTTSEEEDSDDDEE